LEKLFRGAIAWFERRKTKKKGAPQNPKAKVVPESFGFHEEAGASHGRGENKSTPVSG